jgi:hypothetical protein
MEITGQTYSTTQYEEFKRTGNKNIFEEIIDRMILDGVSGMNESFRNAISNLPTREKRMTILSLLDKDLNLFKRIKSLISDERLTKMDHLEQVILMLREYVKVGPEERKKFGEVMTDLNLVKHILSRIPKEDFKNPNKTFIDLANGTGVFPLVVIYRLMKGLVDVDGFKDPEVRYKHIVENQIFVSEIQPKNMFLFLCLIDPYDEYNLNIYCGSSLDDGFKRHMNEVWCRNNFSYSIGNPPFNQMIDMKFVRLSYEIADVTCIVHPSTWLLDEKGKQRAFKDTKELVKDHLESIELFNGNKVFGIVLAVPCCITYIDKKKKSKGIKCFDKINKVELVYNDIKQINKYSDISIYPNLKNKISSRLDTSLQSIVKNDKGSNFYVNISQITGNVFTNSDEFMVKDDFYTLCGKEIKPSKEPRKQREKTQVSFINESDANNFIAYLKTRFVRFCLSILKNNKNVYCGEMSLIPWLDFTQEWTDEKLYRHFDLTEEEIKFIEKNIPKYY